MAGNGLLQKVMAGVFARLSGESGPVAQYLPEKITQAVCVDLHGVSSPTDEQIVAVINRHVRFALSYRGPAIIGAASPQRPSPDR